MPNVKQDQETKLLKYIFYILMLKGKLTSKQRISGSKTHYTQNDIIQYKWITYYFHPHKQFHWYQEQTEKKKT